MVILKALVLITSPLLLAAFNQLYCFPWSVSYMTKSKHQRITIITFSYILKWLLNYHSCRYHSVWKPDVKSDTQSAIGSDILNTLLLSGFWAKTNKQNKNSPRFTSHGKDWCTQRVDFSVILCLDNDNNIIILFCIIILCLYFHKEKYMLMS